MVYCCSEIGKINESDVKLYICRPCIFSNVWSSQRWRIRYIVYFLHKEFAFQKLKDFFPIHHLLCSILRSNFWIFQQLWLRKRTA
jgi:hypothetical protein